MLQRHTYLLPKTALKDSRSDKRIRSPASSVNRDFYTTLGVETILKCVVRKNSSFCSRGRRLEPPSRMKAAIGFTKNMSGRRQNSQHLLSNHFFCNGQYVAVRILVVINNTKTVETPIEERAQAVFF